MSDGARCHYCKKVPCECAEEREDSVSERPWNFVRLKNIANDSNHPESAPCKEAMRCIAELEAELAELKSHEDGPCIYCDPLRRQLAAKDEESKRIAVLRAHREVNSQEHDPVNGKCHGDCIVCAVPWPCDFATSECEKALQEENERLREALKKLRTRLNAWSVYGSQAFGSVPGAMAEIERALEPTDSPAL